MPTPTTPRIAVLCALLALAACRQEPAQRTAPASQRPPARVEALAVAPAAYRPRIERVCRFRARTRVRLRNAEPGDIREITVQVGDRVPAGALLVRLDARELEAELAMARARLRQAELDLRRLERLQDPALVTEDERERARTALALARAEARLLELRLSHMRIAAPFEGVVVERLAEPGENVPARTHLLTLVAPGDLTVLGDAPIARLPADSRSLRFEVRTERGGEAAWIPAELLRIGPTADPITGLVPFELQPTVVPRTAMDGAPCRARLILPPRQGLLVPIDALRRDASGEYLYVIEDGRARRREVRSGAVIGDRIEILSGLAPGQQIVVRGFAGLREGARVASEPAS